MSEPSYPVPCRSCEKLLYGPVKYCPYCGVSTAVIPIVEAPVELQDSAPVPEPKLKNADAGKIDSVRPDLEKPPSEEPDESPSDPQTEDPGEKPSSGNAPEPPAPPAPPAPSPKTDPAPDSKRPDHASPPKKDTPEPVKGGAGKWRWAGAAILLLTIFFVAFSVFWGKSSVAPPPKPPKPGVTAPPNNGKRETARILASEALHQGTDLSVAISKLPQLEKVLQAASDLQEMSPRYQDQVTSAKNTIAATHEARDKRLMAYIRKVIELGRHTPEDVSYAIGVIQNGDPTPREKIVVELLAGHIKAVRKDGKSDSAKILSSFTTRFSSFVD